MVKKQMKFGAERVKRKPLVIDHMFTSSFSIKRVSIIMTILF